MSTTIPPEEKMQSDTVTYTTAEDETLSEAVIAAMTKAADRATSPEESGARREGEVLAPLFETIDLDALDALFNSADGESAGTVTFTHSGHEVTVKAAGEIVVSNE